MFFCLMSPTLQYRKKLPAFIYNRGKVQLAITFAQHSIFQTTYFEEVKAHKVIIGSQIIILESTKGYIIDWLIIPTYNQPLLLDIIFQL